VPGIVGFGLYGAINTANGKIAWKIKVTDAAGSGMLVAGDLVFFGETSGNFRSVSAASGDLLWTFDATTINDAGSPTAAPIAYMVNGREFIANAFGGNPNEGSANKSGDAVIVFALPGMQ
jgi:outer membrane protein assembly factor BamB